ncbi:hypothetical protein IKG33_03395 [Candidatus Saccharibacteria bacterium]|nr:hypothetical protein [Candidatus Saccharibacteria bacterium]
MKALEGENWTVAGDGLTFTIRSVEQNGMELAPIWNEYIYNENTGDFGDYYFSVANSADKVRVGVLVDGMEEGKTYKIFGDQTLTSELNGQVIYNEERPSVYMEDSTKCEFEEGEEHCRVIINANEYKMYVTFYEENWEKNCHKTLIVRPERVGSRSIEIMSVMQNGEDVFLDTVGRQATTWEEAQNTLQTINEFRLDDYNAPVEVTYKFKNLVVGKEYSASVGNNHYSFKADATEKTETRELRLNLADKHISASISLSPSDSYSDSEYVYLYFRVADPSFVALGDIIVDEISQNGIVIQPEEESNEWSRKYTFRANDVQPLTVRLHATRATAEMNYYLSYSMYGERGGWLSSDTPVMATGEELEQQGVILTISSGYGFSENSPLTLNFRVNTSGTDTDNGSQKIFYENYGPSRDNSDSFKINYYEDENIPRCGVSMLYSNGESVSDVINPKLHDAERPLVVRIDGERYSDEQTYTIRARVSDLGGEIYNESFTVTGAELNAGYEFALEGLTITPPEFDPDESPTGYDESHEFSLEIDDLELKGWLYCMYDGWVDSVMTYAGGEVVAIGSGDGMGTGPYLTGSGATVRKTSLDESKGATLHYRGSGFDESLNYNYAVYYNGNTESGWSASAGTKIEEGVVSGSELNREDLSVSIAEPSAESEGVLYTLAITINNKIVIVSRDYIAFTDEPKVESFKFTADSDSFMQMGRTEYRLARNTDATATLTGVGFEDAEEYRLWVSYEGFHHAENEHEEDYPYTEPVDLSGLDNSVVVNGAELNAGYEYNLAYTDAFDEIDYMELVFNITDKNSGRPERHSSELGEGEYGGHSIYVEYTGEEDVFHGNGYQINDDGTITDVSQPDEEPHGPDEPGEPTDKPDQVVTFYDGDGKEIGEEGITKYYGDDDFTVTMNVTTGDGTIREYHPDDGESEHPGSIAHTIPDSDLVGVGDPGDVEICAWVNGTDNYAETRSCYTVHVLKRPLNITGVTIEDKYYDGYTTDAVVTGVTFEDWDLNNEDYEATAEFDDADAGENKALHVNVSLRGGAVEHYDLGSGVFNTTGTILPYRLIRDNVELLGSGTYGYNPNGVEPEVRVRAYTHGGDTTLGFDSYDVSYNNNTSVGTGHVTVTGKGNYTTADVPVTIDFTIEPRGINDTNLVAPNSIIEGRILNDDDISINVDGSDLVKCEDALDTNCDYVMEITGNDGIVEHTVHIAVEGRNNYTGVAVKDINIVAKLEQTVEFNDVVGDVEKAYGDANFTYTATSTGDGAITYTSSNTPVATVDENSGEVTIHGVGEANIIARAAETDEYAEGMASYHIVVGKKTVTISNVTVSNKTYDGTTDATVTDATLSDNDLLVGDGFSIDDTHFLSANVGDYNNVFVRIKLDDDAYELYQFDSNSKTAETAGSATISAFTLGADNTSAALSNSAYTYDGSAKEPTASVAVDLNGDGTKETDLTAGTDYTISYSGNVNAGTATATITGTGNYTGSLPALEFTISAAPVENVTVTASAQTYTGSALEPVPTVTGTVGGEQVTFTTDDYYIIEHGNFIGAGDYTFGVASGYNSNYYIPITNGSFTISKAESGEPGNVPTDLTAEVGKTLAELGDLPEGLSWVDNSAVVTVGMNEYAATYTKNGDAENYNSANVTILVLGYTNEYEVIEGAGQEYIIDEDGSALFEINADYALFEEGGKVYVDGVLVDASNYDSWSNSTVIRFKKAYMDSLALGEHSLAVLFNDGGIARTTFTVDNPVVPGSEEENPGTADTGTFTGVAGGAVATGVSAVVVVVIFGRMVALRRIRKNRKF